MFQTVCFHIIVDFVIPQLFNSLIMCVFGKDHQVNQQKKARVVKIWSVKVVAQERYFSRRLLWKKRLFSRSISASPPGLG